MIEPTDRVWCGEACVDLLEVSMLPHVLEPPWWIGDDYALEKTEGLLYAIDLVYDGRWVIDDARVWSVDDESSAGVEASAGEIVALRDEVIDLASAGEIVALRDEVIDLAQHRVVSAGPWWFHAVQSDGTAIVTDDLEGDQFRTEGPVRLVPPGTFERGPIDDEEDPAWR